MARGAMNPGLVGVEGIATLKMLREQSFAFLPEITYRRLVSEAKDRYGDSSPSDREYKDYRVKMIVDASPEEVGIGAFTMDFSRTMACVAPIATFDRFGFDPKRGDAIMYDEALYEVVNVTRQSESRIGSTNEYLCFVFETRLQRAK